MAVTLKNSSGYKFGVETDETGIKVARFNRRYEPEFKEFRHGLQNLIEGAAIGDLQCTITIEGEINNTTGVMAITATAYFTPAGDVTEFGYSSTAAFLLNSAEVTEGRGEWKTVMVELQGNAGLTA